MYTQQVAKLKLDFSAVGQRLLVAKNFLSAKPILERIQPGTTISDKMTELNKLVSTHWQTARSQLGLPITLTLPRANCSSLDPRL